MEDILDIYKKPYNPRFPVICMDESNKAHEKSPLKNIPVKPGQIERFDTHYERNGISNIFLSFEPLTGKRWVNIFDRRTRLDWAKHIQELVEKHYADAEKIILIVDNLNIHTGASLYELLEPEHAKKVLDKLEIHYTPKHGSWLNMAEIEFSHLSRQCLKRRLENKEAIENEVNAWVNERNKSSKVVKWQFTTTDARIKLKKLYPVIESIRQN